jgi:hypothetical protein
MKTTFITEDASKNFLILGSAEREVFEEYVSFSGDLELHRPLDNTELHALERVVGH